MLSCRLGILAALLAPIVTATGPAAADEANILLGQWHLTGSTLDPNRPGFTCTRTDLAFAPDRFGFVVDGKLSVFAVLGYAVKEGEVDVLSGGVDAYTVIDHNTIEFTTFTVRCTYTRTR